MARLDDPALDRLWDALADRLQRNGLAARGVVTLSGLDRSERFALAGLVGRPLISDTVRVDLATLDARLRSTGVAAGLVPAVVACRGPLADRRGERAAAADRRRAVREAARKELASTGLEGSPWVEPWLDGVRPIVARVPPQRGVILLPLAVRCLARLPWAGPRRGRAELASSVAGNSHALDDGTVLGALVLRAIALMLDAVPPATPVERRALWERVGVLSDEVSTTVLTLGLRPDGADPVATGVRARSGAGCEAHLTLRDLRRLDHSTPGGTVVWVCENPRVLEAAMEAGTAEAMVCTAGNPTTVVQTLLERLAEDGARLRYRGDFDWPGVAIANRIIGGYSAEPWRMRSGDYEAALGTAASALVELPELQGQPVQAVWDAELTGAMQRAARIVHEEAMLELLVADLTASAFRP